MHRTLLLAAVFHAFALALSGASLYEVPVKTLAEEPTTLAPYAGKVLLIVNVASECGYTPQYEQLEAVYQEFSDDGLVILGFPCNQFGGQEPGSNEAIASFCKLNYGVTFPLFDKIEVNGPHRHPLYEELAGEGSPYPGDIGWNFTKFLIGRDGTILHRYPSNVKPDAPALLAAIKAALAAPAERS